MTPDHSETEEIHLVTGAGKSAFICETIERALLRWEELGKPHDWRVVKVTTLKDDVTPATMGRKTKSAEIKKFARDRGIPVADVPLSIVA